MVQDNSFADLLKKSLVTGEPIWGVDDRSVEGTSDYEPKELDPELVARCDELARQRGLFVKPAQT